jgi:hypothetical protein
VVASYEVIDTQTGQRVRRCQSLRSACRVCDRLDQEYGAVRYIARRITEGSLPQPLGMEAA